MKEFNKPQMPEKKQNPGQHTKQPYQHPQQKPAQKPQNPEKKW